MRPTCETSYLGSEFLFDDLPNAFSGPNLSPKPEVLGPFLQKRGELLGPLLFGKFWRAARPRFGLERLLAPFAGLFHPLTDGAFAHAEGLGNVGLFPAVLLQLKGSKAAGFTPIGRSRIHKSEHASFEYGDSAHRIRSFTN
jgi:hypothetical protein